MSPKPESANEDNPELPTKNKQTPLIGSLGDIISYLLPNSSSVYEPREVDGWDDVVGRLKSDNGSAKLQHQMGVVDETLEDLGATLDSSQPHTATVQGPIENPPGNAGESGGAVDSAGQIEESGREKTCNEKEELKRRLGRVTRKNEKLKKEVTDANAKIEESKRIHEQRLDEERKKSAKLEKTLEDVNALLTSVEVSFAQHKTDASLRIDKLTEENKELLQKTEKLKQDLSNTNRMVEDLKRRRKQDQERLKQEKQSAAKLGDASRFSIVSPTSSVPPTPLRGSHGAEQGNDVICKLLTDANDALRNENLSLLARVDELTRDRLGAVSSAAAGELEKAEREVVKLRQDLLAADAMIKEERRHRISVRQTLEEEKGKVASLKDQLDKASSAMGPLDPSSDAGILKTALQRTETLLKTRTAELRLAESYLPKRDTVTSEIIITAVQEINMKILDIAVSVSEAVTFPSGPKCVPSLSDRKIGRLKEFVGEKLFSHLRDKDHSVDPTFVQLAVQTTLAGIVRKAFLFWPFRTNSDLAYGIETVFQHMLIHGHQTVALRWRSLATMYYRSKYPDNSDEPLTAIYDAITDYVARILLISGFQKDHKEATTMVLELLKKEMKHLYKLITNLSAKVKEHASLANHELFLIPSSKEFDEKTMHNQGTVRVPKMKNARENQKVLCTVELGVKSITNPTKLDERSNGKVDEVVMTKAVVVFEEEAEFL